MILVNEPRRADIQEAVTKLTSNLKSKQKYKVAITVILKIYE